MGVFADTAHDMRTYLLNQEVRVMEFIVSRCGLNSYWKDPVTFAILDERGEIVAAALFEGFRETWCNMHTAILPGFSLTRKELKHAFSIPFHAFGLRKVLGIVPANNQAAIEFNTRLGFKCEGILTDATPDGEDILLFALNKDQCRWIR